MMVTYIHRKLKNKGTPYIPAYKARLYADFLVMSYVPAFHTISGASASLSRHPLCPADARIIAYRTIFFLIRRWMKRYLRISDLRE